MDGATHVFEKLFVISKPILLLFFSLITTIDDIYDVYGTMDELELFMDVVERFVYINGNTILKRFLCLFLT
jgi:hypothetical protein